MPRNMAVKRPDAWIVGIILSDNMAIRSQHLNVATLWVLWVGDRLTVPEAVAFMEYVHVVAVKVHWLYGARVLAKLFP